MNSIIPETESEASIELVGGKGRGLLTLKSLEKELNDNAFISYRSDVRVPRFFVVPPELGLAEGYKAILKAAERLGGSYAVRSSSPLEDTGEHSFDGIFLTELDVPREMLVKAIHEVRESSTSQKARKYAAENGIELTGRMPVIVQSMVREKDETGVVYSRFPCPKDILKIVRDDQYACRYINAFLRGTRDDGTHYLDITGPFIVSRDWNFDTWKTIECIGFTALTVEDAIGHPVIMEFAYYSPGGEHEKVKIYPLQARKLTGLSEAIKFQMPELQEAGLIGNTYDLNGTGDFTGDAYVSILYKDNYIFHGLEEFDRQHPDGYVFVTPYIQFDKESLDERTPNKKAVVAYRDLGRYHDMEISRKKGILYLNANDSLSDAFSRFRESGRLPINTGEKVRVVSDGERGFIYNLSRE